MVLLMAVAKIPPANFKVLGASKLMALGNSSPSAKAKAYLPLSELISIVLLSSTTKVKGCSGKVFKVSNNNLAGTATEPLSFVSTSKLALIVVSKSEAEIFKELSDNSNKKLSKIGKVLLLFMTPPSI